MKFVVSSRLLAFVLESRAGQRVESQSQHVFCLLPTACFLVFLIESCLNLTGHEAVSKAVEELYGPCKAQACGMADRVGNSAPILLDFC